MCTISSLYVYLWKIFKMHIGKIIKAAVKHQEIGVTEFAEKINTSRRNAYKIFAKPGIDTDMLIKINKVLGKNLFFNFLMKEEIVEFSRDRINNAKLLDALKEVEALTIVLEENKKKKDRIKRKRKEVNKRVRSSV